MLLEIIESFILGIREFFHTYGVHYWVYPKMYGGKGRECKICRRKQVLHDGKWYEAKQ